MLDSLAQRFGVSHVCRRVAALAVLSAASLLAGCQSSELFGKLDEANANAVLEALYAEGITAKKLPGEGSFWRIEVDHEQHQRALHVVRGQGLPREQFATMGEVFKKEGLVSTPSEERLRYIYAVSQELANTLSQIDGVITVRVHPVIPFNDPLDVKVRTASASVFIKHSPEADIQQLAPAIRTLVTRSIEGLAPDNVSLTFVAAKVLPRSAPVLGADTSPVMAIAMALAVALTAALIGLGLLLRQRHAGRGAASAAEPRAVLRRPESSPERSLT